MQIRRIPWTYIIGAVLLVAVLALVIYNWNTLHEALLLMSRAHPAWLALGALAIFVGFVCAGQIYGRVLRILGYHAPQPWLISAALVSILISQSIPAGTVGSYAFLTASMRRRGIPATSVALLASLELLSWIGGMLVLFSFGLVYKLLTIGDGSATRVTYPAALSAILLVGSFIFIGSRPHATLHDWAIRFSRVFSKLFGQRWSDARILTIVDELDTNRRLIAERPLQALTLLSLQLIVFTFHALALVAMLHGLGASAPLLAVLAAYGLALIVSTFTALPGGGGTVEAALALSLTAQGVPAHAALGATILFRLFSFWLLLPLGAVCYRILTTDDNRQTVDDRQ